MAPTSWALALAITKATPMSEHHAYPLRHRAGRPLGCCGTLLPLVYDELRSSAAQKMAQEQPGQTLRPAAWSMRRTSGSWMWRKPNNGTECTCFTKASSCVPSQLLRIQARPIGRPRGAKRNGMPGRLMMRRGAAGVRRRRVRRAWLPPYRLSPLRCRPPLHFATPPRSGNRRQRMPCDREYSRDTH